MVAIFLLKVIMSIPFIAVEFFVLIIIVVIAQCVIMKTLDDIKVLKDNSKNQSQRIDRLIEIVNDLQKKVN